jgi:N-acetylglutamate synthase-like GNAT family acetyltransferase
MTGDASIRLAELSDVDAIAQCIDLAYRHYIERISMRPAPMDADYSGIIAERRVFVLEVLETNQVQIAGVLVMQSIEDKVLLESVAVVPHFQGHGLGAVLLDKAESYALDQGRKELHLYTHVLMVENISYYSKRGYQALKRISEAGFDRLYMCKPLS